MINEYVENETKKIFLSIKKLQKHLIYVKHYYSFHAESSIGTNTMLHVVVSQKNTDWKDENITLTFDVTDYSTW